MDLGVARNVVSGGATPAGTKHPRAMCKFYKKGVGNVFSTTSPYRDWHHKLPDNSIPELEALQPKQLHTFEWKINIF